MRKYYKNLFGCTVKEVTYKFPNINSKGTPAKVEKKRQKNWWWERLGNENYIIHIFDIAFMIQAFQYDIKIKINMIIKNYY